MEKQQGKIITQTELISLTQRISQEFFEHLPFIKTSFSHGVSFNNRLRTTAGRYVLKTGNIELNPSYYQRYGFDELVETIKHELIHYHLHQMALPYQHRDKEFKLLAQAVSAKRYAEPMREYKHLYCCSNCSQLYPRVRKINIRKYRCGKCKGKLNMKI